MLQELTEEMQCDVSGLQVFLIPEWREMFLWAKRGHGKSNLSCRCDIVSAVDYAIP